MIISRRSTFELVLVSGYFPAGVRLLSDCTVRGLVTATDDPYRVVGVRTADGRTLEADYVLDASGRRSDAHNWLAELELPGDSGHHGQFA